MGLGEDDIKLQVGIDGVTSTKSELDGLTKAVNETKDAGKSIPVVADGSSLKETTGDVGDLSASLNDLATIASVPQGNIRGLKKLVAEFSGDLGSLAAAGTRLTSILGGLMKLVATPVFLIASLAVLATKAAYDRLAESTEKQARIQARANDEMREALDIMDKLKDAEEARTDILASTEEALQAAGASATPEQIEKVTLAAKEASARTGAEVGTFIGPGAIGKTADELIRASGLPELAADSPTRQKGLRELQRVRDDLDLGPEREAVRREQLQALNAAQEAATRINRAEALGPYSAYGYSTGGEAGALTPSQAREQRAFDKQRVQIINDQRNSIILGGRDTRKALPDSHVPVP